MSLTKEDLKNIEKLFKGRFDSIDKRFEEIDRKFEEIDKRFDFIDQCFDDIDKRFLEIERRDTSHELTFMKMFKRFDTLETMITRAHIRENNNRDRLDKVEIDVDDLRRSIFDYNDGSFRTKSTKS